MNLKSIIRYFFVCLFLFLLNSFLYANSIFSNLRTDYLQNPIGIDNEHPRFSWKLKDFTNQNGYKIIVAEDEQLSKVVWNSGKREGRKNLVTYEGHTLKPFTRYYWNVEIWDSNNKTSQSTIEFFETGFMNKGVWKGAWISDDQTKEYKPAPYFRKTFQLASKKVKDAKVYIAVGGLYELQINGHKIGNHRLDPAFTRFDRRILYSTFDVTKDLLDGKNTIGVILGNGWYNHQSTAVWFFDKAPWRNRPTFCLDLRITYDDGSVETVSTDRTWKTTSSPIIFNSIYTAEHYDSRLAIDDWSKNDLEDSKWKGVTLRSSPSNRIEAQAMHPIRNVEKIVPKQVKQINDTLFLVDFGRNISGVTELNIKGEEGTILRLEHGERLGANGRLDMSNINMHYRPTDNWDPFQTDIVILSGKYDSFMPKFNYKGFQYVEVASSKPIQLTQDNIVAHFMHSDVPAIGKIQSSNPVLDKVWEATNNAYLSNLFGYPTDCPQREKNGWTGDAHIAIETGLYNFDGITVYEKWIQDHIDEQQPNGVFPAIIPTSGWGYHWANGLDWTSTIAIIPWNMYLFYGDSTLLARSYSGLKKYVDYVNTNYPTGLTNWGLGDWVPVKTTSTLELTSSIYYYVDVEILAKSARILGYPVDAEYYKTLAEKIKNAINSKYLNRETGIYANGTQTELSMALYWRLVPDNLKAKVAENLVAKVKATNYHLDVGLLGTKSILNALSENGYPDVAYQIASQEDYPSWGWWIKNGATTLYENWNIESENDISLNHIMFGEIGAWYYKALAGIKPIESAAGFERFDLKPFIPAALKDFSANYESIRGNIGLSWTTKGKQVLLKVTVPSSSEALFVVPTISSKTAFMNNRKIESQELVLKTGEYNIVFK